MATNKIDYQVWMDRWKALDQAIQETGKSYADMSRVDLPRSDTILALLDGLRDFANHQFGFFMRFATGQLVESIQYPPEHALAVTVSQIGYDLGVIQRAAQQRRAGTLPEKDALEKADQLAWIALQPAISMSALAGVQFPADSNRVTPKQWNVLTYFNKMPQIHMIPYANIAVIGIPYTCITVPMDYLAGNHECGHAATERIDLRVETRDELNNVEPKYRRWWKEILADVYGCLFTGPVLAFDFQEMALQNSSENFVRIEDEHPSPYLRPRIYHKVLHAQGNTAWADMAEKLESRWKGLKERGDLGRRLILEDAIGADLSLDLRKPVDYMIRKALDILQPQGIQSSSWQADWSPTVSEPEKLGKEFTDAHIQSLIAKAYSNPPDMKASLSPGRTRLPPVDVGVVMNQGVSWEDWVKYRLKVDPNQEKIHVDDWKRVLQSDGWTDGGPQNDPAH